MRFGFVTCVQLGLSCMEAIYEIGGKLDIVVTLEDDMAVAKSGRVYLDEFCTQHDISLTKIRNINRPEAIAALEQAELDWLFIIGWSQIAREDVLKTPTRGVLGMHPTLLPVGRGRAAIPWAILKGLDKTGVTLFQMDAGVDTGPIISQLEVPLHPMIDAGELYRAIDHAHVALAQDVFPKLASDEIVPQPQDDSRATEWPGRKPEDGEIDLSGSVEDAERLIRAVTRPYPGAFTVKNGKKYVVWSARKTAPTGSLDDKDMLQLNFKDGRLISTDWDVVPPSS